LPEAAGELFTSGSSAASVEAFVAAREFAHNPERPAIHMSDQTHQSLVRAARVVGIHPDRIRKIRSDTSFSMDIAHLRETVKKDIANGCTPIVVVANAGTTSTGCVDLLDAIADFCDTHNIWFHIDAAYGGFACITERGRKILRGIERAHSITLDGHKWFFSHTNRLA